MTTENICRRSKCPWEVTVTPSWEAPCSGKAQPWVAQGPRFVQGFELVRDQISCLDLADKQRGTERECDLSKVTQQYSLWTRSPVLRTALRCFSTGLGVQTVSHSPRGTNATPFFFRLRFSGADSRCLAVRRASASSGLRARGPAAASRVSQSSARRRSPGCDRQPALLLSLRRVCRSPSVSQRRCFSSAAVCGDQCVLVAGLPGREKHPRPCVSR